MKGSKGEDGLPGRKGSPGDNGLPGADVSVCCAVIYKGCPKCKINLCIGC